jgi:predicted DNA-binding transcriptional regulator YafY
MERLVRLIGVLNAHRAGAPVDLLLRAVAPEEAGDDARRRMLSRDLAHLNHLGYDIRNVADSGADGVYVMRARDNRLQVHLTPEQRGELLRAAIAAGLEGMGAHLGTGEPTGSVPAPSSGHLDLVQRGTTRHCLVRFEYKGEPRVVHPARVHSGPSGWYLAGREDGQDVVKKFVVSRMSDVSLDKPGTAEVVEEVARPSLDPLSWQQDPPTDVELEVPAEHRLLVENLLGRPASVTETDGTQRLTYTVTNRAVFRWRVYELGTRVRVLGPEDVRRELLAELESFLAGVS